ncbi:MAG: glycosyltransferase family 4 protein, partial [Verrucomicrobiota bacterium]
RAVQICLYRLAMRSNRFVVFQNPDDRRFFVERGIVKEFQAEVVSGSGVDLERYPRAPLPIGTFTFLMIARLIREKGVEVFLRAAELMGGEKEVKFVLVGGLDPNPGGLSQAEILGGKGNVEWVGEQSDVVPFIRNCHCFVLPSYYREGIPRSILEAMAVGRPVITTDSVGCRETVEEGENGWKIPVRDHEALAGAMLEALSLSREELQRRGDHSRRLAEDRFDVDLVNAQLIKWVLE